MKELEANILERLPKREPLLEVLPVKGRIVSYFWENSEGMHFGDRKKVENSVRHAVGTVIYGVVGVVDGVVDGVSFGISEVVEDASFLISRTITKAKEGWQRGKE